MYPHTYEEQTLKCPRMEESGDDWEEERVHMEFGYADWPCERPDNEEVFLGGRGNAVARKERACMMGGRGSFGIGCRCDWARWCSR